MNYRNEREFNLYNDQKRYWHQRKPMNRLVTFGHMTSFSVGIMSIVFLGWLLLRAVFGG